MHGIDERQGANRVRQLNRATKIVDRTERVAAGSEGHDLRLLRNQSLEIVPNKLAGLRIHLREIQRYTALFDQCLPGRDVSVMLQFSCDNLIARTHRAAQRTREVIDHCRGIRAERNFVRRRIEKIGERVTC